MTPSVSPVDPAAAGTFLRQGEIAGKDLTYGTVELFLFSAATWNPHRVHYDQHYAQQVAGQSGLLVQGPLQAATMFQALRDGLAEGVTMQSLEYRHVAMLHVGEPARIAGRLSAVEADRATVEMWVESVQSGQRTTTGIACLRRAASTPATGSGSSLEGDR